MSGSRLLVFTFTWVVTCAPACNRTTELLNGSVQCVGAGPAIHFSGADPTRCSGAISSRLAEYGLCSCNDLVLTGGLSLRDQPMPMPMSPASRRHPAVGTDGALRASGPVYVDGSLVAAGLGGVQLVHGGDVHGSLKSAGDVSALTPAAVGRDFFSAGDVLGRIRVSGTLHLPDAATVGPDVMAPTVVREAVTVDLPCDCIGKQSLLDLGAEVTSRKAKNDNDTLLFATNLLDNVNDVETLDWSCGQYYLTKIETSALGALTLRIHGHVGIFVEGDVRLGGNLAVALDPGSDLDLVVAGSFYTQGRLFGSPDAPARTRLWVASTTVSLPDQIQFAALVYAPAAVLSAGAGVTLSGTMFVDTLAAAGDVRIVYDEAAALGGEACDVPPVALGP